MALQPVHYRGGLDSSGPWIVTSRVLTSRPGLVFRKGMTLVPDGIPPVLNSVFQHYPNSYWPQSVWPLQAAGGFSGARVWKVESKAGPHCLRRWPKSHPDQRRLRFIHEVLAHAAENGFSALPLPILTREENSFVSLNGRFWELARWLPGEANYRARPEPQKLSNAFEVLAQFHLATASYAAAPPEPDASPGIQQRLNQIEELASGGLVTLATAVQHYGEAPLRRRGQRVIGLFNRLVAEIRSQLQAAHQMHVAMQPCIRDIWHDHVLFVDAQVSGLIDFGAMRIDNVACDVARLLGSMAQDQHDARQRALVAYQTKRQLSLDELLLIEVFDRSTVLLAGINWLQWICVDGKRFDDMDRVLERLDELLVRLETAAGRPDGWS